MKKTQPDTKPDADAKRVVKMVGELYQDANDYVEKHELEGYIGKHNEPNVAAMDESHDIGAEDVLMLGSYMTLRKLMHTYVHEEKPDVEVKTDIKVHIIGEDGTPKLPKEVRDALRKLLDAADDEPKKKGK